MKRDFTTHITKASKRLMLRLKNSDFVRLGATLSDGFIAMNSELFKLFNAESINRFTVGLPLPGAMLEVVETPPRVDLQCARNPQLIMNDSVPVDDLEGALVLATGYRTGASSGTEGSVQTSVWLCLLIPEHGTRYFNNYEIIAEHFRFVSESHE